MNTSWAVSAFDSCRLQFFSYEHVNTGGMGINCRCDLSNHPNQLFISLSCYTSFTENWGNRKCAAHKHDVIQQKFTAFWVKICQCLYQDLFQTAESWINGIHLWSPSPQGGFLYLDNCIKYWRTMFIIRIKAAHIHTHAIAVCCSGFWENRICSGFTSPPHGSHDTQKRWGWWSSEMAGQQRIMQSHQQDTKATYLWPRSPPKHTLTPPTCSPGCATLCGL